MCNVKRTTLKKIKVLKASYPRKLYNNQKLKCDANYNSFLRNVRIHHPETGALGCKKLHCICKQLCSRNTTTVLNTDLAPADIAIS